jgi:hypothetical protein
VRTSGGQRQRIATARRGGGGLLVITHEPEGLEPSTSWSRSAAGGPSGAGGRPDSQPPDTHA